jgi:hypothetical protein
MKINAIYVLFIAVLFTSGCRSLVTGNGEITSIEKELSPFTKIASGGSAEVRFHTSEEYRAVVTADLNLLEYVVLKVKNNTLIIGPKHGRHEYSFNSFTVDVYGPALSYIAVSGSGRFIITDKLIEPEMKVNISGSGKLTGDIETVSFTGNISGSGSMVVKGTSDDMHVAVSGSGIFDGKEYQVNNAYIRISGSGISNIWVKEYLDAKIFGSGNITYRGNPRIILNSRGLLISEQLAAGGDS